ncbi:MAG: ABC transporter permease [Armatimonadetes bacterium]|nr:ABC transporter permease [Armatimonadota bacterium]
MSEATATIEHRTPHLTIRPSRGWSPINLRELWMFRDLLLVLAGRDVKLRYRQTALGAIWVILQPLMAAGIFAVVFGKVAKLPSDGVPYFLFAYAGQLGWGVFSGTLSKSSLSLVGNAHLVSKIYFPRLVLPLSTTLGVLLDFAVALGMMVVLMALYHVRPHAGLLLLPVWMVLILMLSLGLGLIAAALTVSYRDIQHILPVIIPFIMYASPVAYSMQAVPASLKPFFLVNPMSGLLEAFRWSLLGTGHLRPDFLGYSAAAAVLVFFFGAFSFRKMERKFADVI